MLYPDKYDEIVIWRYVKEKKTIVSISEELGITNDAVRTILDKKGIKIRRNKISDELAVKIVEMYVKEKKSTVQIEKTLGIAKSTVRYILNKKGIQRRQKISYYEKFGDKIVTMYIRENKNMTEIAKELGIPSTTTIKQILDKKGIKRRQKISHLDKYGDKIVQMYVQEKKAMTTIAKKLKISDSSVRTILDEKNIEIRQKRPFNDEYGDKIVRMYVEEKKSMLKLAEYFGISDPTVRSILESRGVKIRKKTPYLDKYGEKIVRLYVEEKKSTSKIANELRISKSAVNSILNQKGVKKRKTPISNEQIEKIVSLYTNENKNMATIAKELKIGNTTVSRILDNEGVEKRPNQMPIEQIGRIVRMYVQENKSMATIAKELKIGESTVHYILDKQEIERRRNRISSELVQKIIHKYSNEEKGFRQISKELGVSETGIRKTLIREGIEIRPKSGCILPNNEIKKRYIAGESIKKIAESFRVDKRTITKRLMDMKITIRSPQQIYCSLCGKVIYKSALDIRKANNAFCSPECAWQSIDINNYNKTYFNIINNPLKAYFLGIILSCGTLSKNKGIHNLYISVPKIDRIILTNFIKSIAGSHKLLKENKTQSFFILNNKKLVCDLLSLGVPFKDKSYTAEPLDVPEEFENSFWLGLFDADGSVGHAKYERKRGLQLRLVGTKKICQGFSKFLGYKGKKVYKHKGVYEFNLCTSDSQIMIKLHDKLYNGALFWLPRKRQKFIEIISQE